MKLCFSKLSNINFFRKLLYSKTYTLDKGKMSQLSFLNNPTYKQTMKLINQVCIKNDVDQSHGLPHAVEIALHVKKALDNIPIENTPSPLMYEQVMFGAFLHDVDDHKYFKSTDYSNAREILSSVLPNQNKRTENIIRMIDLVSFSKNGNTIYPQDPIEYYFPRYADRVEAIGLIGLYRTYQYSSRVGSPFYTEQTVRPQLREEVYQMMQGRDQIYIQRRGKSESTIDHILDKLLHIKLPEQIKNAYLHKLYQDGHEYIMDYLLLHAKNGYVNAEKDLVERVQKMNAQKKDTKEIFGLIQQ